MDEDISCGAAAQNSSGNVPVSRAVNWMCKKVVGGRQIVFGIEVAGGVFLQSRLQRPAITGGY